ncbi:hypothetical protein B4102_3343 [Heyndrickxia sporothermodurans]|uniref:Uncharacterized protein n=1 Tax=Heyndrickxia sporothermodurans TaxID=46224 RepID=A0A150KVN6_9BACI|nr:hypothetical protein [Heyndrickxia sporothermodurans]KYD04100.1 hypothetical protein B4102_3343 [Heyndrickxia sporothermodurans]MBB2481950.1 hypothetical protein [Bacillus sp. APMAM]RTZ54712.1 hypothetical protein EKO25_16620 [Bacillus sp. SAJ1]
MEKHSIEIFMWVTAIFVASLLTFHSILLLFAFVFGMAACLVYLNTGIPSPSKITQQKEGDL